MLSKETDLTLLIIHESEIYLFHTSMCLNQELQLAYLQRGFFVVLENTSSADKKLCLFIVVQESWKKRTKSGLILNLKKQS